MKYFIQILFLISSCILIHLSLPAQDSVSSINLRIQEKYTEVVGDRIEEFEKKSNKYTGKALGKIIKQEKKMQQEVAKADSMLAIKLFSYSIDSLQKLKASITGNITSVKKHIKTYSSYADTLKQSLSFLIKTNESVRQAEKIQSRLQSSLHGVEGLESKLAGIENFEEFIVQRQKVIKEQLQRYPQLAGNLKRISKQAYYYSAQIKQYKETLQNPSQIEKTVIQAVKKLPAFQQLMQRNSALSGLFASPASFSTLLKTGNIPVVNGLPSRATLQAFIQSNIPSDKMVNLMERITQQLPDLQLSLNQLERKIKNAGGKATTIIPDFKPNTQRTKSIWKRLEYGTDLQFGKSVSYLPATAVIAARVGYKLNDKSTIGAGSSYTMGLGSGWKNIRLSTQAVGLRTYVTWKLRKGLDIQGGSEWNYMLQIKQTDPLKHAGPWQQSALLGLSKQYAAGKKLKGNVQVLYDFLSGRHQPASQPVVFRFGYSLR